MKTFSCIIAAIVLLFASVPEVAAQYAQLSRKGVSLYSDGVKLTPEQMRSVLDSAEGVSYQDWRDASRGFNAGKGLLIGFGALTGAGILTAGIGVVGLMMEGVATGIGVAFLGPLAAFSGGSVDVEYTGKFAGVATAGLYMIGTGLLCMVAGTTVYCIYKKQLNTMTAACNASSRTASIALGPSPHGLGLTLNF